MHLFSNIFGFLSVKKVKYFPKCVFKTIFCLSNTSLNGFQTLQTYSFYHKQTSFDFALFGFSSKFKIHKKYQTQTHPHHKPTHTKKHSHKIQIISCWIVSWFV